MDRSDRKYTEGPFLIKRAWDIYARLYDAAQPRMIRFIGAFGDLSYEEFEEEFVRLARLKPGWSVLDVACGTGAGLPALSEALGPDGDIVAADISSEMLRRAAGRARGHKIRNVAFREVDAEKLSLEFDEESFDAVLCCNGLPNFLHPRRAIIEMSYAVRDGGKLAFSVISKEKFEKHPVFRWMARYPEGRLAYMEEYGELLAELGFDNIKFHERGLMLIMTAEKRLEIKPRAGAVKKSKGDGNG